MTISLLNSRQQETRAPQGALLNLCGNLKCVKTYVLYFSFIFLLGCGSVQKFPTARFTTPETNGIGRTKLETGATQAVRLQPSPDLRAANVSGEPQLTDSLAPFLKPSFGLGESVDLETYLGPKQAFQTALKIQIFGQPISGAGAGNFALAIRLGYALYVAAEEIKAGEVYSTPPQDRALTMDSGYSMFEVSLGYRIIDVLLLYAGVFKDDGRYNLKFKEGDRTTIIHEIETMGYHLGLQWNQGPILANFNISKGDFEVTNRSVVYSPWTFGFSLGVLF